MSIEYLDGHRMATQLWEKTVVIHYGVASVPSNILKLVEAKGA